jgi:hypothetical protein
MKNKILALLFALSFFGLSCNKADRVASSEKVDKQLITEITKLTNVQAQKTVYRNLNKTEKYQLWQDHLNQFVDDKSLSAKQLEVLQLVIKTITPDFFASGVVSKNPNYQKIAEIDYMVKKEFKENDLLETIFSNVSDIAVYAEYPPGSSNCKCSSNSDYCSGAYNICYDMSKYCDVVGGCGTLWSYDCNGLCFGNPQ